MQTYDESGFSRYFCSDTVFNLSKRVFLGIEIKILEKSLDYALIQRKFNKLELNSDSEGFFKCIRIKC